ncbi:hypothetical protein VE03_04221 [Pseudogymnoascus sp. 23342-1-I1]|nr:hypothetical protein VE03_04221 [Pseudogymnoascus sp. 23342-1-I1]
MPSPTRLELSTVKQQHMARTFTRQQVVEFLALIDVPQEYRNPDDVPPNLSFLRVLHTHMISTVPYETLVLHYSPERRVRLDPQHLFQKIVRDGRGRGGYCLENNLFFLYMLRDLGFQIYPVGTKSRLRIDGVPQGEFQGWGHIVQIVTFPDGSRWVTDVCFGGDGPTQPMRLMEESTIRNMGTQDARLIRDFIPGQVSRSPEHKMWQYQCRNSETGPWRTFYGFSDAVEWLPADFGVVNCFTGSSLESSAVTMICMVKFLRRETANCEDSGEANGQKQEIFGKRMLVNELIKENLGGKTRIVQECRTEEERVQALREWFGVELTEEERLAIKGHITEVKP